MSICIAEYNLKVDEAPAWSEFVSLIEDVSLVKGPDRILPLKNSNHGTDFPAEEEMYKPNGTPFRNLMVGEVCGGYEFLVCSNKAKLKDIDPIAFEKKYASFPHVDVRKLIKKLEPEATLEELYLKMFLREIESRANIIFNQAIDRKFKVAGNAPIDFYIEYNSVEYGSVIFKSLRANINKSKRTYMRIGNILAVTVGGYYGAYAIAEPSLMKMYELGQEAIQTALEDMQKDQIIISIELDKIPYEQSVDKKEVEQVLIEIVDI